MQLLRANTEVIVRIGPFVDVGDGFTPQTDITLGGNEAELLKAASVEVDISGNTWAATTNCRGWYDLTLSASNTDTEGLLVVVVQDDSDCLPVFARFMVMAEAAWDSMFVAKDDGFMDVNIKTVGRADTQETEANNLESACANYSVTRGLTGTAVPAVAGGAAGGLVLGSAANNLAVDAAGKVAVPDTQKVDLETIKTRAITCGAAVTIRADVGAATIVPTVTEMVAAFTEIKGATWAAGTDTLEHIRDKQTDIETDTAVIGALGAGLTAVPWNAAWDAEVQSEVEDALKKTIVLLDTTVNTPDAQGAGIASFTLTAGSGVNDFYNGRVVLVRDANNSNDPYVGRVIDYAAGGNLTITEPHFTVAAGDLITILPDNYYAYADIKQVDGVAVVSSISGCIGGDIVGIGGDALSANDFKDFVDTGYNPATHKVAGVVLTDTVTTYTGNTPQTGDSYAIVNGAHGLVSIQDDIDEILIDTAVIGALGAGLTAIPWNAAWDAEVQSEVADALDAVMPAIPTADSLNERILFTKYVVVNKKVITEASGDIVVSTDNDAVAYCTVAEAFLSVAGVTTQKKLE